MPARDLYVSDWFHKARGFVEAREGNWFILSAKHGLLRPDQIISTYDVTLKDMGVSERKAWAMRVVSQLNDERLDVEGFVVLASIRYREFLLAALREMAPSVEVPMEGLRIGEQLRWLKASQ